MTDTPAGPDARTAAALSFAAEVFGNNELSTVAGSLVAAADQFPSGQEVAKLREASILPGAALKSFPGVQEITKLISVADLIPASAAEIRRYGGER